MILKSFPRPYLRLLIIDQSPDFVLSLRNRLQGLDRFDALCHTAVNVAEAWEALALQRFDAILAGLPLPSPAGSTPAALATVFSLIPVIGFNDTGSGYFLHESLCENVVITLPRSTLDNSLLEQCVLMAVNRSKVCRQLELAQTDLLSAEKRFQNIIVNNADGIVVVDMEGRIRFANLGAEKLFGVSARQLVGEPFGYTLFSGGSMEIEVRTREGRSKTLEMRVVQSRWDGGELVYLATLRDISPRKRLERDLTTMKEAAEAASQAKSRFLANMSHEIRTPMNGILGMTELLLNSELTRKQRDYLDMVRQSASSLMEILNDILDFSKIEAGKLELEDDIFDLHDTIRSAIRIFIALAQNKGLALEYTISENVPRLVRGDSGRLRQIVVNLVGNAVKFTSAGSIALRAECPEAPMANLTRLKVSVTDTGPGIERQKLDTIFESFTQADNSSTRKFYGTGVGLAICKHLVERMGGVISVETEEDRGSCFRFEVNLRLEQQPSPALKPQQTAAERPRITPLTILLAEDNPINQLFATEILEQDGHTVIAVGNGREALQALARHQVDAVLMDIQMPEMDGLEATRRIRAGEAPDVRRDVPIIAMTAHALKGDRERFLQSGMDGYLSKPVGSEEIHEALVRVLNARANVPAIAAPAEPEPMILNIEWLLEKARGNRDFLKKLFGVFVEQQPVKIGQMREALDARDMAQVTFMAHTLKGGAATMGAEVLRNRAFGLEKAAKAGDAAQAEQEMNALADELAQTMRAMRQFMS